MRCARLRRPAEPFARLTAVSAATAAPAARADWAGLVLVTGEAGIGKTTLLARFAAGAARRRHGGVGDLLGRRPGAGVVAVDPGAARAA